MTEERERYQSLIKDLLLLRGDVNEAEKTFSRIHNEYVELGELVAGKLNINFEVKHGKGVETARTQSGDGCGGCPDCMPALMDVWLRITDAILNRSDSKGDEGRT